MIRAEDELQKTLKCEREWEKGKSEVWSMRRNWQKKTKTCNNITNVISVSRFLSMIQNSKHVIRKTNWRELFPKLVAIIKMSCLFRNKAFYMYEPQLNDHTYMYDTWWNNDTFVTYRQDNSYTYWQTLWLHTYAVSSLCHFYNV
jgi:hypothetical protein